MRNAKKTNRVPELTRLILMTVGALFLSWLSTYLFQQDWLLGRFITKAPELWREDYSHWVTSVCIVSTISTFAWYVWAVNKSPGSPEENLKMRLPWAFLSLMPVIPILLFVFLFTHQDMKLLCIFLFLMVGIGGYWLGTALNSPQPFELIPPFSSPLRTLFRIK
jgi:hypothetical protein